MAKLIVLSGIGGDQLLNLAPSAGTALEEIGRAGIGFGVIVFVSSDDQVVTRDGNRAPKAIERTTIRGRELLCLIFAYAQYMITDYWCSI